jgi:hypothetical protein
LNVPSTVPAPLQVTQSVGIVVPDVVLDRSHVSAL